MTPIDQPEAENTELLRDRELQATNRQSEIIGENQSDAVREKLSWLDERDRVNNLSRGLQNGH